MRNLETINECAKGKREKDTETERQKRDEFNIRLPEGKRKQKKLIKKTSFFLWFLLQDISVTNRHLSQRIYI